MQRKHNTKKTFEVSALLTAEEAFELSEMYKEPESRHKGYSEKREKLLVYAAQHGHLQAQYSLARLYDMHFPSERNLITSVDVYIKDKMGAITASRGLNEASFSWYEKAAEQGHVFSQLRLALHFASRGDFERAEKLLAAAAGWNSVAGRYCYGMFLLLNEDYKDTGRALELLSYAGDRMLLNAQEKLFEFYYAEKNYSAAKKWARLAAGQGSKAISAEYGRMLLKFPEDEEDLSLGADILRACAESEENSIFLTWAYLFGKGVERNIDEAFLYLINTDYIHNKDAKKHMDYYAKVKLGAIRKWIADKTGTKFKPKLGLSTEDTAVLLGIYLYFGKGIRRDTSTARHLWEKYAEHGNILAKRMLARAYMDDADDSFWGDVKRERAMEILLPLADEGNVQAMADLKRYGITPAE